MKDELIKLLTDEFGPVKWFPQPLKGVPGEGWFLLEVSPLPPSTYLLMVAADISNNTPTKKIPVALRDGKLYHSKKCTSGNHHLPRMFRRSIESIEDITFRVAVYPGEPGLYVGQPVAIALDPTITYIDYPDHPHLNLGGYNKIAGSTYYIPDSFCYTDNPASLGSDEFERLLAAFDQICIWLFRHQVWLATRKQQKPGCWIGPNENLLRSGNYAYHINPFGLCRCGREELYLNCHLPFDVMDAKGLSQKEVAIFIKKYILSADWSINVKSPQQNTLNRLVAALV